MSNLVDYQSLTPPILKTQQLYILPPHDAQRHIRKSMLGQRVYDMYHGDWRSRLGTQPPVLCEPAERRTGQRRRVAILSLPPEILNEIFSYFHREYGFIPLPINQRHFPWNIAGVSSQWRRAVWSVLGIFDTIAIGESHGLQDLDTAQVQMIQRDLLHTLSLSTTLVALVVYPHILSVAILCSHQIRELRLHSVNQNMLSALFRIPPGSFSHLEELDVRMSDGTWIIFPEWGVQVMPTLRALYVNSNHRPEGLPRPALPLPWTQLTELEVADTMTPNDIIHILRHSRHMVRGTFSICEDTEETMIGVHLPFTLPHLTFLSLFHQCIDNVECVIDALTLPSLEKLDVSDDDWGEASAPVWSHQPYTALINRSHCAIKSFMLQSNELANADFLEDTIEPLLRALPAVKILRLDALVPSSTFLTIRQNGLLSKLENVVWTVDAAGTEGYIDWLLSFEAGGDHALRSASAAFHTGRGFVAAEKRFSAVKAEISLAGIDTGLFRCDCSEMHSDLPEDDSDEDSDG